MFISETYVNLLEKILNQATKEHIKRIYGSMTIYNILKDPKKAWMISKSKNGKWYRNKFKTHEEAHHALLQKARKLKYGK